jgi:hypothetical protein
MVQLLRRGAFPALAAVAVSAAGGAWAPASAQALFSAGDVDVNRFVLVAAPIGSSGRSQLNIYEQLNDRRACYEVGAGKPAPVNPLLGTFDFTGICGRYIDANGFSARVGEVDLATTHRLSVIKDGKDVLLMALPTRSGAGPEMLVARAGGAADGFVTVEFEPGWTIKRRQFGGRALGHVYLFTAAWPGGAAPTAATPATPQTAPATPAQPAAALPWPAPGRPATAVAPAPLPAAPAKGSPVPVAPVSAAPVKAVPAPVAPPAGSTKTTPVSPAPQARTAAPQTPLAAGTSVATPGGPAAAKPGQAAPQTSAVPGTPAAGRTRL